MKKLSLILMFLVVIFSAKNMPAADNQEFRAAWVITWEFANSSESVAQSKARVIKILDNIKKANMNAVLWQVRQGGTAYYNSSFEPWGSYSNGPYPDNYDILAFAVQQAHKRGLELHAWFNVFAASSLKEGAPAQKHPEWVCRDRDGQPMQSSRALSPGLDSVRAYTINVAMEVVRNYDIDGLHLDYVRWNEYYSAANSDAPLKKDDRFQQIDGFMTDEQIERLNENQSSRYLYDVEHPYSAGVPTGFDTWEDWWRWSVTEFVRTLHDSVQSVKPWVRLSPAALGKYRWSSWQGYGTVYQDAALWFNEGYIDQLTPMHYHWTTGEGFLDMLVEGGSSSWGYWIQPGVEAGRLFSAGPGSYVLDDNHVWYRHKEIVESCRTVDWLDGFQFFSYGSWEDYQYWEDAKKLFFPKKTRMKPAEFLYQDTPEQPSISLLKMDSLTYQLDITPPTVITDHWFALYRSEDDSLSTAKDEIIDIHFGKESYAVIDSFSGTQDFDGQYTYFATMLDRFWNESDISNWQISAPIPSFAPQVIATFPVTGDSLPVNEDIIIYFSKTMDAASAQNSLTVDGGAQISALKWSADYKSLTVSFSANLKFNTLYTLTINDSLQDINGKALDGDGDGSPGGDFVFSFRTLGEDKTGPRIEYSNLNMEYLTEQIDVQDVVTFAFDELLDHESVTAEEVKILRKENTLSSMFLLHDVQDKTVLSLQPEEPFGSFVDYTIWLGTGITDTAGNPLSSEKELFIRTDSSAYAEEKMVDEMRSSSTGTWQDPDYSGSTTGTIPSACTFSYNDYYYLPSADKRYKKHSGELNYAWNPDSTYFLLREYCSGGLAKSVTFDTGYVLQVYIYGDGSGNKFRFSLKENSGNGYPLEVSQWHTIDWLGWKIVQWDLSDPNSVGTWLGNEILDGTNYNIDSYQLTHPEDGAISGRVFFKNLRAVKKESYITGLKETQHIPQQFSLKQNYPNPFNPLTTIEFTLPTAGKTQLVIYNILGQKVRSLVNKYLPAGNYNIQLNAHGLASGAYIYELRSNRKVARKRMIFLK